MNTLDIRDHLVSRAPWIDPATTVDTVKSGDPRRPVTRLGVGWMATIYDLRAAVEDGCDLFITHEPTFNDHLDPMDGDCRRVEPGRSKQEFLEQTGLVVLRCHDVWDAWPGIGIRDSWARGLGLTNLVAENAASEQQRRWHAVYRIEPVSLREFATDVARRVRTLGQDGVDVLGDPDRRVCRPAVGVGCGGPDKDMIDAGADVLVVCYDGASYWQTRERLAELGAAVIAVEHGTSEIWGMQSLARYLQESFPEIPVRFYDRHPRPFHVA